LQAVAFGLSRFARKVGKVFHVMVLVLGKSFRFLVVVRCPQVFVMALVFMFNVILPELREKVYDGRAGSQQQLASLQVPCPTQRAPDGWDSARFPAVCVA